MYAVKPKTILDLCSGLGGWTEAFAQQGWNVIRIENNPALSYVPFTQLWDVLEWEEWIDEIPHPEIVVASPPCLEFSDALQAPRTRARREGKPFEPDMSLVRACLDIIDYLKPNYWILENVRGAQEDFRPLLGARRQKIGSFYLWGNFPLIITNRGFSHAKDDNDPGSSNPLRSNIRAMIPFEISFALFKTLQGHTDLRRWY